MEFVQGGGGGGVKTQIQFFVGINFGSIEKKSGEGLGRLITNCESELYGGGVVNQTQGVSLSLISWGRN